MDSSSANYVFSDHLKAWDMAVSLALAQEGTSVGHVMIADPGKLNFGHIAKMNLSLMRKYLFFIQEAFPVRIKAVHVINTNPLAEKVVSIAKPFLKKEIFDVVGGISLPQ